MDFFLSLIRWVAVVFVFCSLLLNCAAGNVWLKIEKDKSGKLQFLKKEYRERRKVGLDFLKSSPAEETDLYVTSLDVKIPNIDTWEMEGASLLLFSEKSSEGERDCLLFTLNTSKDAKWFQYFGISEWSLNQIEKEANLRDDLARFNNLLDSIVWEISMPGNIVYVKDYEPLDPDWGISNHGGRKAILRIPARDILKSRRRFSTYLICSSM